MREGQKQGFARHLRKTMTDAERAMWHVLRNRSLAHCKFRRQHPVDRFILDFACIERRLAIELDGGHHLERRSEEVRTALIEAAGYRILRFWNNDVLTSPDLVLAVIFDALAEAGGPTFVKPGKP